MGMLIKGTIPRASPFSLWIKNIMSEKPHIPTFVECHESSPVSPYDEKVVVQKLQSKNRQPCNAVVVDDWILIWNLEIWNLGSSDFHKKKWCSQNQSKNRKSCIWIFILGGGNSNIFYVHPYLGRITSLTCIFQMGWNHQLVIDVQRKHF